MTNDANGWGEYRRLILDSLKRIEERQEAQENRLSEIEILIAQLNGARKFAILAWGFIGGVAVWLMTHVFKSFGKG